MAGRPRNTETVEADVAQMIIGEYQADPNYGPVKQLVRKISTQGMTIPELGIDSTFEVDKDVTKWVEIGYELKDSIFLGSDPAGSYDILYILVKSS